MQLLLSAYSQTEDIIVAAMVNNRKRPELADVIGPFANNVSLRSNLSGQPSGVSLITLVHASLCSVSCLKTSYGIKHVDSGSQRPTKGRAQGNPRSAFQQVFT